MEPCTQCGNPYKRSHYQNASPFCSAACRNRATRGGSTLGRKPQEWLACTECGAKVRKGRGSAQPERVRCRACRKASRMSGPHPCPDCDVSCYGEVCRACRAKRQTVRALDDARLVRHQREHAAPGIRPCDRKRLLAKWKRQGKRCTYCPNLADTIDHVVPLVRGGTNYEGNLAPACRRCNGSKCARTVTEWRAGRSARRMTKAPEWKRKAKPIRGEQVELFTLAVCQECSTLFAPHRKGLKYCDGRCMTAANRRLNRTRYRVKAGIDPDSPYQAGIPGATRVTPRRKG